jgi:hypothetical protein
MLIQPEAISAIRSVAQMLADERDPRMRKALVMLHDVAIMAGEAQAEREALRAEVERLTAALKAKDGV